MPVYILNTDEELFQFVICDYSYRIPIWEDLTCFYLEKYDADQVSKPSEVRRRLISNFHWLGQLFEDKVSAYADSAFLIYMYNNHDTLAKLYIAQLGGLDYDNDCIDRHSVALERRINKMIIEQMCRVRLNSCADTLVEIKSKQFEYVKRTEELLYIGIQLYLHSNYISEHNLLQGSRSIEINQDGLLSIPWAVGFRELLDLLHKNMLLYGEYTEVPNYEQELKSALNQSLGVDVDHAMSLLVGDNSLKDAYGFFRVDDAVQQLHSELHYSINGLYSFYAGLILHKDNAMSATENVIRGQENERFLFRPIIEFDVEGRVFHKTSFHKYIESWATLMSMGIQFHHAPQEWLLYDNIRLFVNGKIREADKILEDPAYEAIEARFVFVDRSVKSLQTHGNDNVNIDNKECGEIDIIAYDSDTETLYIFECKNGRQRTDMNAWARDISQFQNKYEPTLERKVKFIRNNTNKFIDHLSIINEQSVNVNQNGVRVEGIFIINAPTMYMFIGNYRVFTLQLLNRFCDGGDVYPDIVMSDEEGNETTVKYPYLQNYKEAFVNN